MADDLLRPRPSPFTRLHHTTRSVWRAPTESTWDRGERLYGLRGLYKPTMSARTVQRLGDVRHALAQRAIAGTLEVHAPFSELTDEARELVDRVDAKREPPTS